MYELLENKYKVILSSKRKTGVPLLFGLFGYSTDKGDSYIANWRRVKSSERITTLLNSISWNVD
jgi:hypothetical protein